MAEVKYSRPLPKYCQKCGSPMVIGKPKQAPNSYNDKTGKYNGRVQYTVKCQKLVGFKINFRWHDKFFVTDTPHDEIWPTPHRSIQRMAF